MSSTAPFNSEPSVRRTASSNVRRTRVAAPYRRRDSMDKEYFFLTIPGVIRLLEILLAGLNLGGFGYYCTYYDKEVEDVISPIFLANTWESFFFMVNCNTFFTAFSIIVASMISFRSHSSLLGSLFMFIFDFLQFLLVLSASAGLIVLYNEAEAITTYGSTLRARQGLSVTGMLLACFHLIGCIYDLTIYIRRTESQLQVTETSLLSPPTSRTNNTGSRERILP